MKQDGSDSGSGSNFSIHVTSKVMSHCGSNSEGSQLPPELEGNERLKSIEPRMVELILNEVGVEHLASYCQPDHTTDTTGLLVIRYF